MKSSYRLPNGYKIRPGLINIKAWLSLIPQNQGEISQVTSVMQGVNEGFSIDILHEF